MSRFLFLTWDGAGNQPPAMSVAHQLRSRGHEIVFAGYASQQARLRASGFRFVLLDQSEEAARQASGERDVFRARVSAVMLCSPQLGEVPRLFAQERADALVVDGMMFAALAAAEAADLPAAVLVPTAPGALLGSDGAFEEELLPALNEWRTASGLPVVGRIWDAWRGMPVVVTSIPQLDPRADDVPAGFRYVGPVFEQARPSRWRSPWSEDDERPLVLVSFSTSAGAWQGQRSKLERTLRGLASTPWRILATVSETGVSDLEVPDNAVLVRNLPHTEILPQVRATVTHAGHGTTITSLAYGVPLVMLPRRTMPPDQVPLAARVQALGAGRALDGDEATDVEIAHAVHDVVGDPSYRERAGELATCIWSMPGAAGAAIVIERLVTAHPPARP